MEFLILLGLLITAGAILLKRRSRVQQHQTAQVAKPRFLFGYAKNEPVSFTEQGLRRHALFLGVPGSGKTRSLVLRAKAHLEAGHALILLDPHGTKPNSLYQLTLAHCLQAGLQNNLVLIDPSDPRYCLCWNPTSRNGLPIATQSEYLLEAIQKATKDFLDPEPKPQHERWLLNSIELLTRNDQPLVRALDWLRGMRALPEGIDPENTDLLTQEWLYFINAQPRHQAELTESIFNRLRRILASPALQTMFSQAESRFHLSHFLKEPKIILANLGSSPWLSRRASTLLGSLLLAELIMALEMRGQTEPHVAVICDEASRFVTPDLSTAFAELRGYGCSMTLAAQSLSQLNTEERQIMETVLACSEMLVTFRVGFEDALRLAPQLLRYQPKRIKDEISQTKFEPYLMEVESSSYTSDRSYSPLAGGLLANEVRYSDSSTTSYTYATEHQRFQEVSSRTFFSLDEQMREAVELLLDLPDRQAILKDSRGIVSLQIAEVKDANLGRDKLLAINEQLFTQLPFYATIEEIQAD